MTFSGENVIFTDILMKLMACYNEEDNSDNLNLPLLKKLECNIDKQMQHHYEMEKKIRSFFKILPKKELH